MVLHVRFISKCKEQLINKLFIEKIVKQKLLFYQWKEVKKKVEGRSEEKVIESFQIPLPFFFGGCCYFFFQKETRGTAVEPAAPRAPLSRRQFVFLSRAQQKKKKNIWKKKKTKERKVFAGSHRLFEDIYFFMVAGMRAS